MQNNKKISITVIRRLPRYYRYLSDLLKNDINKISSLELSKLMGVTASQIRQDFSNFGTFGQQGYGYSVQYLYSEIQKILNFNKIYKVVIIGIGNVGHAITNYIIYQKLNFDLVGLFDNSNSVIGTRVNKIRIRDVTTLSKFLKENQVDIVVLTLPSSSASLITKIVIDSGVKGIWNFCPCDLKTPDDVVVENVNLGDALMTLAYRVDNNGLNI